MHSTLESHMSKRHPVHSTPPTTQNLSNINALMIVALAQAEWCVTHKQQEHAWLLTAFMMALASPFSCQ